MSLHVLEIVPAVGWIVHVWLLRRRVEQARRDPLTGLHTRVGWTQRARRAIRDPSGAAVVLIDLDGFKSVNDTCGHHVGDMVLTAIGWRLADWCRAGEPAGRLGGDEFVAVVTGQDVATRIGMLCAVLNRPVQGAPVEVSASIGYALTTTGGLSLDLPGLMQAADKAMYAAKYATRNPESQQYPHGYPAILPVSTTRGRSVHREVRA